MHKGMKDGRLNRCKKCTTLAVKAYRQSIGVKEDRRARYERELELGSRTRKRAVKVDGVYIGQNPDLRRANSLAYTHKKRSKQSFAPDELTALCMKEASLLASARERVTGAKWTIDHIVPLAHKEACGLHVAANIQVVPAAWNFKKGRSNMDSFWI